MATYIVRAGESDFVKIGKADDPEQRVRDLQVGHPELLTIIRVHDAHFDSEEQFHGRFASQRVRGEWFRFHPEMLTFMPAERAASIEEVVASAKRASVREAFDLIEEIWQAFRTFEKRGKFTVRLASLLQVKKSRARHLMYGTGLRVDVHEIEGLRALARRLRKEIPSRNIRPPMPLFDHDSEGR